MKKSFKKLSVNESKIDSQIIRMLTREGFIEVFWEELYTCQKEDPSINRESVFNRLNEKYFKALGSYRYSNYDSFRQRLNK